MKRDWLVVAYMTLIVGLIMFMLWEIAAGLL